MADFTIGVAQRILWVDSSGVTPNWQWASERTNRAKLDRIESYGRVIFEDDERVIISPHINTEDEDGDFATCGDMEIAKCCIVDRQDIVCTL